MPTQEGVLIAVIVAGFMTGLLVLGAVTLGAWIGFKVKTRGEELFLAESPHDDSVSYVDDDIGEVEVPLRRAPSVLADQVLMGDDEQLDQAASDIIADQNQRMLAQVLARKAMTQLERDAA
jgi:hypothetical protein